MKPSFLPNKPGILPASLPPCHAITAITNKLLHPLGEDTSTAVTKFIKPRHLDLREVPLKFPVKFPSIPSNPLENPIDFHKIPLNLQLPVNLIRTIFRNHLKHHVFLPFPCALFRASDGDHQADGQKEKDQGRLRAHQPGPGRF